MKKCRICNKFLKGREDKLFCSIRCKNYYHTNLRKATAVVTVEIDSILHRNRSILLELMGKNTFEKRIPRMLLEKKKFRFKYHTHNYTNSRGKTYYYIYDFGWMEFSNDVVMLVRKNRTQ